MRWMARVLVIVALVAMSIVLAAYLALRASLPQLDGQLHVAGLHKPAAISRDALGVVTISAHSRADAAFATGFAHAQERFFQMDLQRRAGAGELAELLGPALVETDKHLRIHRFRDRAERLVATLRGETHALFEAYAAGVNTGLGSLGARPFEYFVLRAQPRRWQPVDTLLTMYSMWFELNDETAERESELALLRDTLPASVYAWLIQSGTDWDAPLRGGVVPPAPLPTAEQYDLRAMPASWFGARDTALQGYDRNARVVAGPRHASGHAVIVGDNLQRLRYRDNNNRAVAGSPAVSRYPILGGGDAGRLRYGSNNWAVAGSRTASGHAIVAGDMHLGHRVPNIWFRARLIVTEDDLDITGVMLSGAPLMVAGSNGRVAWAYTNSYGDWEDLVVLETDAADPTRYRTADGWETMTTTTEMIAVRGARPVAFPVRETRFGPVIDEDHRGRPRALHWLAHAAAATNADLRLFERASNIDEAVAAANRIGIPPQNVVIADATGRIGWTITGRIPRRVGVDPLYPSSWTDGRGWQGWVATDAYPRIVDPPLGLLWTANARAVDGDWLALLGEGNHPPGARAGQIRDGLLARNAIDIADMLEIQLDDRAVFLGRWQALLLAVLDEQAIGAHPQRALLRDRVRDWGARAAVDSAGYRLVKAFRALTIDAVTSALLAPVRANYETFELTRHSQLERPVWQAISEQPLHLLDPRYETWDAMLLGVVDDVIALFEGRDGGLAARTWGERNTVKISHPLADSVPLLGALLRMRVEPLPGDENMPRVQGVSFGASQRMAVSPGREREGYFHMPGGQSGHPLSPYFGAGHDDWARGRPAAFLPGPSEHRLALTPQ